MSFVCPDVARSAEDFDKCRELHQRLNSGGTMPAFGEIGNQTYVIRDDDERSVIHGLLHVEHCVNMRALIVDPNYPHSRISFVLLQKGAEMNLRTNGAQRYYFTVPKDNKRVISMFEKDGATVIDAESVRFLKVL